MVCKDECPRKFLITISGTPASNIPLPMAEVYENLSTWRGSVVTDEERSNAVDIYAIVMGSMGGDTFNGDYESGGSAPIELDASMLTDPTTKNAADLVAYVTNAWNSGWGYIEKKIFLTLQHFSIKFLVASIITAQEGQA